MLTSQTVEILKSLNKEELKRLGDFIRSPYFNTSKPLEKIFEIVHKAYPSFEGSSLQHEKIFKKLYPSEAYNEKRIKNLYSEFSNLLKKFLGYEYLSSNKQMLDVCITTNLTQKNLAGISDKIITKSLQDTDDGLLSIPDRFHYLYQLNENHAYNLGYLRKHSSPEYLNSEIALIEKLTIFFVTKILQLSFYDVTNHRVFKIPENPILKEVAASIDTEKIITYLHDNEHPYSSYIRIHYLFYQSALNNITEEQYIDLKKELLQTIRKVKKNEQNQFITRMIRTVISKLINKDRKYYYDILEYADLIHELKIFPEEDVNAFINGPFRDIFITSISLNKFDWAENFLNEYMGYVSKDLRPDSENYCRAILSFNRKNFEESLNYLSQIKMIDIVEKLTIRCYYIMNYIELRSYESALSAVQSLKQFINDSGLVPEMFLERLHTSIKYFTEIIKCKEKGEKIEEWLYKEAMETELFFQKKYIMEKLRELM
jgi:hypothetical protein